MLAAFWSVCPVNAQDCSQFAILDHYSSSTDYKSYERVKDVLCHSQISESSSARSAGIKAGIPIPVLDDVFSLTLSGTSSSSDYSKWSDAFCHSSYYDTSTQLKQSTLSSLFSDNAAATVQKCLDSEPVYGYFDVAKDGGAFAFTFHAQGREKLKKAFFRSSGSTNQCDPDNPFNVSTLDLYLTDLDISGQKKSFGCHWDGSKDVVLTIKLANQGDRTYILPVIVKREDPPPPERHIETPQLVTDTLTSRLHGISGNGHDWGAWYTLCTDDKPAGWTIASVVSFHLEGDRQCGAHANCEPWGVDSPTKVCRRFQMQGHDEAKPGVRDTDGVLIVVWQHPK
jgi:hypothetical protein